MIYEQIPVKITVYVDRGVADVVSALNDINGKSSFSSCEGINGEWAHIYFDCGQENQVVSRQVV